MKYNATREEATTYAGLRRAHAKLKAENSEAVNEVLYKNAVRYSFNEWLSLKHGFEIGTLKASFAGLDLSGVNLSGGDFSDCIFDKANLTKANLAGADLTETSFKHTKCEEAIFDGATLRKATFKHTNVYGASLDNVDISRTKSTLLGKPQSFSTRSYFTGLIEAKDKAGGWAAYEEQQRIKAEHAAGHSFP